MRTLVAGLSIATVVLPLAASAQTLLSLLALASTILNSLIYLLITLAIVAFFFGLIRYIFAGGAELKAKGLQTALYGVIVIFVMVSIWGIVRLLQSTFRVTSTDPVIPKTIQLDTRFVQ